MTAMAQRLNAEILSREGFPDSSSFLPQLLDALAQATQSGFKPVCSRAMGTVVMTRANWRSNLRSAIRLSLTR